MNSMSSFAVLWQHNENQKPTLKRMDEIEQVLHTAKIDRLELSEDKALNLDEISLKTRGWKDDFVLVVVFMPLLLSFIPDYAPTVQRGFEALEHIPQPYWFIVGAVVVDVLGMRAMLRYVLEYFAIKFKGRAFM
ncbi:hypothetical protein GCM10026988_18880 [Vibrio panuliri]